MYLPVQKSSLPGYFCLKILHPRYLFPKPQAFINLEEKFQVVSLSIAFRLSYVLSHYPSPPLENDFLSEGSFQYLIKF